MTDTHIKIKPVTPKVQYTGNGVTTVFPYEFPIFDETDMVVYVGDDIIESGYSVSGAGETDGGNVTFDTAPDDGAKITLLRNVPIERLTDFQEGGTFRPKNLNDEFDRQTAFVQQVQEKVDRTLILPPTSEIDPKQVLGEVERIYTSIDNVDAVADDLTNIDAVADDLTNIDSVANDLSNIDAVNANKTNIDAVAGNETNINAVASNSTNINAVNANKTNIDSVAGNNSDISTVATNMSDVNTCATNIASIIDAPNQAANAAESAALSAQYANDKINQTHITNCIIEIPQDIKLELSNGTLTLKSGSKVTNLDGTKIEISTDRSVSIGANYQFFIYCSNTGTSINNYSRVDKTGSGASLPEDSTTYNYFYNSTDNKIYAWINGSWVEQAISFPICIVTVSGGAISSIDQVFNGLGYIGSCVFTLPGLKGLYPRGRNADGTLNSGSVSCTSVQISSQFNDTMKHSILLNTAGKCSWYGINDFYYNKYENFIYGSLNNAILYSIDAGTFDTTSGKISNFKPNTVFQAADYNNVVKYSDKVMVDSWGIPDYSAGVSISSGYTAVSNGMVMIIRGDSSDSVSLYVDGVLVDGNYSNTSNEGSCLSAFVKKGSVVTWTTGNIADTPTFFPLIGG